jgi:HPt (histidine-containing phosphotransfer) domain-containing protein
MSPEDCGNDAPRERPVLAREELLERLGGDEQLLRQVLEVFASDAPVQLEALLGAVDEADQEVVWRRAHGIKGAAANVGAIALKRAAFELEAAARAGNLDQLPRLAARVGQEIDRLQAVIKEQ